MERRNLGRTGVSVSKLCLGAMMFGQWGNGDAEESVRIIHAALDAGVDFIDTADVYSDGESERIVARALAGGRRDGVFLATKVGLPMGEGPNARGASRRHVVSSVEDSLRRLGTDWIDLYQIHRPDPDTEIDETLGALSDLVHQGKVRYVGHSTFSGPQIVEAQWVAADRSRERFRCEQPPYSLLVRYVERDVLPTCHRHGLGVVTYSPLSGGWLSGRYDREGRGAGPAGPARAKLAERFDLSRPDNRRKLEAVVLLSDLAEEAGLSLPQLALGFVLSHPAVTAAIAGPRTMGHLESYLEAAAVELSDEVLDRIDEIVPPATTISPDDWRGELDPAARRRGMLST